VKAAGRFSERRRATLHGDPMTFTLWPNSYFAARYVLLRLIRSTKRGTRQDEGKSMQPMSAGITKANTGIDGIVWQILGQTYVPKQVSEHSFAWHATFPPGTFVPPHIHPTQEEFIYMFEGRFDLLIDGKDYVAASGDLIRLPMGISHGIFNKSDQAVKCFFWVTPTRALYDLFWAIHSMKEQKPDEVVALAAKHEVVFLPPPQ